jgi:pilus assembly protein Flp/PilA
MSKIISFLKDESGASAAEYVLILAVIGTGVVAGATLLGNSISSSLSTAATFLDNNQIK